MKKFLFAALIASSSLVSAVSLPSVDLKAVANSAVELVKSAPGAVVALPGKAIAAPGQVVSYVAANKKTSAAAVATVVASYAAYKLVMENAEVRKALGLKKVKKTKKVNPVVRK